MRFYAEDENGNRLFYFNYGYWVREDDPRYSESLARFCNERGLDEEELGYCASEYHFWEEECNRLLDNCGDPQRIIEVFDEDLDCDDIDKIFWLYESKKYGADEAVDDYEQVELCKDSRCQVIVEEWMEYHNESIPDFLLGAVDYNEVLDNLINDGEVEETDGGDWIINASDF